MLISINNLNSLYILVLLVILLYLLNNQKALELFINDVKNNIEQFTLKEHFLPGVFGFQLGIPLQHKNCLAKNDCFPGSPLRSQIYQNVCQPKQGLYRQPIPLTDNCQRTLGGQMSTPRKYYVCDVNEHLQRTCKWI